MVIVVKYRLPNTPVGNFKDYLLGLVGNLFIIQQRLGELQRQEFLPLVNS